MEIRRPAPQRKAQRGFWFHRGNPETKFAPSFRGDAKHRARNPEIPGLVLAHHPGMTKVVLGGYFGCSFSAAELMQ
jgi:hypothetical protein